MALVRIEGMPRVISPSPALESPIMKLPTETLVEIFIPASEPDTYYSDAYSEWAFPADVEKWLPITLTCRHWRSVACGTPSLWRTIKVCRDIRWLDLALPRSRNMNVDILFSSPDIVPDAVGLLIKHACRIRRLFFVNPSTSSYHALTKLLRVPLPALEEVMYHYGVHAGTRASTRAGFDLHPALFPSLNTFRCGSVQINWEAPMVQWLTRISIMDAPMLHSSFTFDKFLTVLQRCAGGALRHLELYNSLPFYDNEYYTVREPFESIRLVNLPKLESLSLLHNKPTPIKALLSHLHLSPAVNLTVYLDGYVGEGSGNARLGLLDILPDDALCLPIYERAKMASISAERMSGSSMDYIKIHSTDEWMGGQLDVTLAIECDDTLAWEYSVDDALRDFSELFGPSELTSLQLGVHDTDLDSPKHNFTDTDLLALFETFPSITTLALHGNGADRAKALLNALQTYRAPCPPNTHAALDAAGPSITHNSDRRTRILPNLRELRFKHLSWSADLVQCLERCLNERKRTSGVGLEYLCLELIGQPQVLATQCVYGRATRNLEGVVETEVRVEGADMECCVFEVSLSYRRSIADPLTCIVLQELVPLR